ncbi:MAG: purine-binding chemotaxis protein CheW [Labilithrix sp.]|nr:purine-binding chemotaxis protein CheW [Labilithrix sp.]
MPRHRHDPRKSLVGFMVGDVAYAVRIEVVREIVNPLDVIELPRAPQAVRGVASFREEVVPVVDLRVRFGLPPIDGRKCKWIVVDVARRPEAPAASGRLVALVVDLVTEVFGTGGEEIRPAPPLGSGADLRGIEGVATHGHGLVFVLDVRAFGPLADAALQEVPASSVLGEVT